ncbi:hypothetical protein D3C81_1452490 [compost metagenome]
MDLGSLFLRYVIKREAAFEFFLLDILNGWRRFHDFPVSFQEVEDEVSACCLQLAIFPNRHIDVHHFMSFRNGLLQYGELILIQLDGRWAGSSCPRRCWLARSGASASCEVPAHDRLQRSDDLAYVCFPFAALGNVLHHHLQGIQTLEQGIENKLLHSQLFVPDQVKHVFHLVRER